MTRTAFISTTIPYVNSQPHLGHALEYVQADAYARDLIQQDYDVYFLTGSDENSLKNVLAAEREGITTRALVARNVVYFRQLVDALQVNVRHFIRTSIDKNHIAGASEIWRRIDARGDLYSQDYEGLYCVGCEQFYSESELIDGKCPEHLVKPELVRERNYFFQLSRYTGALLTALESGRLEVTPESRRNEVISFVRTGLSDISVSRSTERARGWGIPVPGDPRQVIYVWIDALTNYINALDWQDAGGDYRCYWEGAQQRIHVVGKGVLRFHAVYWPAMLLSAGLPLPTNVVVHGYITASGHKLSKSLGNTVDPAELVRRYGVNAVRYYLLAEFSPFGDGDFSEERLIARHNTDLSNGLGNLVNRVTSMTGRYRDGVVPACGPSGAAEDTLAAQVASTAALVRQAMDRYDHRAALSAIWDLVRRTNAYVDEKAPWHLAKAGKDVELDTTLHHLAGALRQLGGMLSPFVPEPARTIRQAVGADDAVPAPGNWLVGLTGRSLSSPAPLFPRLEPVA